MVLTEDESIDFEARSSGPEISPGERVVVTNLDELKVGMTVTATDTTPLSTAKANNGKSEG